MSNNNRIYWATQGVAIAPEGSASFTATEVVHGLQTIGITTSFNLEQVFEIGQLAIYENIEDIPDIEVTMEKVLDGYPLIYHLATRGYTTSTLAGRSNQKCNVALNIYGDTQEAASGAAQTEVFCSGMYVSALSYTFPVEGNCTESVTLVGNNKYWIDGETGTPLLTGELFDGADAPPSGVQRRENVIFDSVAYASSSTTATLLPSEVEGISSSGTNDKTNDIFAAHVQTITVSADLGRDALNELGRKGPYFRYVNFPVEVTTEIEVTSGQGDQVDALEAQDNLTDQTIVVVAEDSTVLDLGQKNKLANITYGGGDAGGGNATTTYSYTGFNDLTVVHEADPT
jgi:hypothetical protein